MFGKKIVLAITGSIAAYKSAFLTRQLIKAGAEVQVIMTPSATRFISPLTLSTLSKRPVYQEIISEEEWNSHVELGLWADAMVVAPATANTVARMANGLCDTLVAAVYLSARCPVFIAPAMDLDMWKHPSTQGNIRQLEAYGNHLIPVGHGELASGLTGDGRMAEPDEILTCLQNYFYQSGPLQGRRVLITAGPTYEPLDPVRFIGNRSSGKMGIALAESFARRGAMVDLILGPSKLSAHHGNIKTIRVETAQEMYEHAVELFPDAGVAVLAAAVSDYRPAEIADRKIKKSSDDMVIRLDKTPDIAAELGKMKRPDQITIGFALETNNEEEHARKKLKNKNFSFIVLNSLRDEGAGFNVDTNKITILFQNNKRKDFELKTKAEVAEDIVTEALPLIINK